MAQNSSDTRQHIKVIQVNGISQIHRRNVLVDEKYIKLVDMQPGLIGSTGESNLDDRVASLVGKLVPGETWNMGHILLGPNHDPVPKPKMVEDEMIKSNWKVFVGLILANGHVISGNIETNGPFVVQFFPFPGKIENIKFDTGTYQLIDDNGGIGSKFLAQIIRPHTLRGLFLEKVSNEEPRGPTHEELVLCLHTWSQVVHAEVISASTFLYLSENENEMPTLIHFKIEGN